MIEQPSPMTPEGTPVWKSPVWPGTKRKFGGVPRTSAWLYFKVGEGGTFTMRELREAIGSDQPNADEHLNRRMRMLRERGWVIDSVKDDAGLGVAEYRVTKIGDRVWLGEGEAPSTVSAKVRREVFERDGNRCVICGVGAGEPYPGETKVARLTVGHRTANARSGRADADNLRTECGRCNEPTRDAHLDPVTLAEVSSKMKSLTATEKAKVVRWLEAGARQRDAADIVHDLARTLPPADRERFIAKWKR